MRHRLLRAGAQRLQAVGVDDDELAPGRREPRPGKLRAGQRHRHQAPARLVLVRREPGRPFEHGAAGQAISRAERSAAAIDSKNASAWQTTLPLRSPRATIVQP
jgi:hypothetical protein